MKIPLKYFSRTTASVRTCTGRLLSCNYLLNDITSAVVLVIISHSEMMEMCKEMHRGLWKHSHFVSSKSSVCVVLGSVTRAYRGTAVVGSHFTIPISR